MMKKLFYVDACLRKGSNTKKIADVVINELSKKYEVETVALSECSFPNMSLFNVTFATDEKECYGLCKAEKVLYITTRGMNIGTGDDLEQATPYIRALSKLWGLGELHVISAQNMDYSTEEQKEEKIKDAIDEGLRLCENF